MAKTVKIPETPQEPDGKVTPDGPVDEKPKAEPKAPAPTSLLGSGEAMLPAPMMSLENQSGGNDRAVGR